MPLPETPPAYVLPHLAAEFESAEGTDSAPKPLVPALQSKCSMGTSKEITVCAADPDRHRLRPLPEIPQAGLPRAVAKLGDTIVIDIHNAQGTVGGWPSNRMMIGLTFGL